MSGVAAPAASPRTGARRSLRPAGLLLLAGIVVELAAELAHPHSQPPNAHEAVFAEYAASTDWLLVHLVQFGAAAVVVAGFVALHAALTQDRPQGLAERLALLSATTTLSAIMLNMAVDGVALKHAVDAWASAPGAERAARFAAAETVRWTEWGAHAFFQILLGLTTAIFGLLLARRSGSRWQGFVAIPAGVLLLVAGFVTGRDGFVPSPASTAALALVVVLSVGLVISRPR